MSYDIVSENGKVAENITSNISPMIRQFTSEGIMILDHKVGADVALIMLNMKMNFIRHEVHIRTFEPENGGGSFGGALKFMNKLIISASDNPYEIIRVYN